MSIFIKTKHIDPTYQYLAKYGEVMWKGFWTPAKYIKNIQKIDIPYILNKMDDTSKICIKRTVLASALVEDKVKTFWAFLVTDIPQTVVGEVGAIFSNSEVVHSQSYRFIIQGLGLSDDFDNIQDIPCMKGRIEYLNKHLSKTYTPKEKQVLKKLVLFTTLVERVSLFSQFYIVMSYNFKNKGLKTLYSLQSVTAQEELYHYKFGLELVNIIKKENKDLWDDDLKSYISAAVMKAYDAEIKLIKWIFENGYPSHLCEQEVVNFVNYNFQQVCDDMGIDLKFDCDYDYYQEYNSWMMQAIQPSEPDFFDNPVGGYASVDEGSDDDDLDNIFT